MTRNRIPAYVALILLALTVTGTVAFARSDLRRSPVAAPQSAPEYIQATQEDDSVEQPPITDDTRATVDLEAGFILDPYLLRVVGGGDTAAADVQEGCAGFVPAEPNVVLNWSGSSDALYLFVYSDSDPVLVVETPEGEVLCNDDYDQLIVDPFLGLEEPAEGTYNIHVGSFYEDEPAFGFLVITELNVEAELAGVDLTLLMDRQEYPVEDLLLPEIDLSDLALGDGGVFGDAELEFGFETIEVLAAGGGDLALASLDQMDLECTGFVSLVPAYSFTWSGGGYIGAFFESDEDSSLVIVTPEGVVCNDNTAEDNLNPAVASDTAPAGNYDIYIGTHVPNAVVTGLLTITSEAAAAPEILSPGS